MIDLDKEAIVAIDKMLEGFKIDVSTGYRAVLKLVWTRAFHAGWKYAEERWAKMIDEVLPTKEDIEKDLKKIWEQPMPQPR